MMHTSIRPLTPTSEVVMDGRKCHGSSRSALGSASCYCALELMSGSESESASCCNLHSRTALDGPRFLTGCRPSGGWIRRKRRTVWVFVSIREKNFDLNWWRRFRRPHWISTPRASSDWPLLLGDE